METSEQRAERAGGGRPTMGTVTAAWGSASHTQEEMGPHRAGPSTPARLRAQTGSGAFWGAMSWNGCRSRPAIQGGKGAAHTQDAAPQPWPQAGSCWEPRPVTCEEAPGRFRDSGRVCLTPETGTRAGCPRGSGSPVHGGACFPGPDLRAQPAAPTVQPGAGGERKQPLLSASLGAGTRWGQAGTHGPWGVEGSLVDPGVGARSTRPRDPGPSYSLTLDSLWERGREGCLCHPPHGLRDEHR